MSYFKFDLGQEALLQEFLDKKYTMAGLNFTRIKDIDLQHKGIDLLIDLKGATRKVDEKAQLNYINCNLPTFAFELNYLKGGILKEGWLFDAAKETEAYALVFDIMHKEEGKKELTSPDDISSCEIMILSRRALVAELKKLDITYETCKRHSELLRAKPEIEDIRINKHCKIKISPKFSEKPVNLIIKRKFLRTICFKIF